MKNHEKIPKPRTACSESAKLCLRSDLAHMIQKFFIGIEKNPVQRITLLYTTE